MHFSLSGTLASMGCGLPYAIAAQIGFPTRQSMAFVGDGGFNMLMGEFATDSSSIQLIPIEALTEKKPTIVEVYVDPFDPPMPPQVDLEFVKKKLLNRLRRDSLTQRELDYHYIGTKFMKGCWTFIIVVRRYIMKIINSRTKMLCSYQRDHSLHRTFIVF